MAKQVNKVTKVAKAKAKATIEGLDIKGLNKKKSTDRINGIIDEVGTYSKKLHERIALGASLIVIHAIAYGDVSAASRLIDKMGPGMRTNDLRDWFQAKGPFTWGDTKATDKEGKAVKGFKLNVKKQEEMLPHLKDGASVRALGSELQKNSYWVWKKEAEYKPFNFAAQIESIVKRNEKKAKEADPRDNVIDLALARKIKALVDEAEAKKNKDKVAVA